jgi:hypothetical protein
MSTRTDILKTPGKVVFDPTGTPVTLYSSDGISLEIIEQLVMLPDVRFGASEQIVTGYYVSVKFKPTQFTTAGLAKLFTINGVRMGGSIVGATDKIVDIRTVDGVQRRIANAYIHQEPAAQCKTGSTILGEVEIRGIIGLGDEPGTLANFYVKSNVAWADTGWDPDDEITPGWDVSWSTGSATAWDAIDTIDGVTVTPKAELTEDTSNRNGLVNVTVNGYGVEIAAKTLNISEELVTAARFNALKPGQKKTSLGRDFKLRATTSDAFITCYNAVLQPQSFTFNSKDTVVGDLKWMTSPLVTSGVKGAHFIIQTTDPDA